MTLESSEMYTESNMGYTDSFGEDCLLLETILCQRFKVPLLIVNDLRAF